MKSIGAGGVQRQRALVAAGSENRESARKHRWRENNASAAR